MYRFITLIFILATSISCQKEKIADEKAVLLASLCVDTADIVPVEISNLSDKSGSVINIKGGPAPGYYIVLDDYPELRISSCQLPTSFKEHNQKIAVSGHLYRFECKEGTPCTAVIGTSLLIDNIKKVNL